MSMDQAERLARIAIVGKALSVYGEKSDEVIGAYVDYTSLIPFWEPPIRGGTPSRDNPLFAAAVTQAVLPVTFGQIKPADIMQAAIEIAGTVRADQGTISKRRWAIKAMRPALALPMPVESFDRIPLPDGLEGQVGKIGRGE